MQTGFPQHMKIVDLCFIFKQIPAISECASKNQRDFCNTLLRASGLTWKDFKISGTKVFFRNRKYYILTEKLKGDLQLVIDSMSNLKKLRTKWRVAISVSLLCSVGNSRRIKTIENSAESGYSMKNDLEKPAPNDMHQKLPRKRKRISSKSNQMSVDCLVDCSLEQNTGI